MAHTIIELIPAKYAENAQTTQFTGTAKTTTIDKFTATNVTGSTATLSVNLVDLGDTAGADNKVISGRQIAAGETYTCPEVVGHSLDVGSFISTIAGTGSAIVIRASGREITGNV